jgi:hypothetical protein
MQNIAKRLGTDSFRLSGRLGNDKLWRVISSHARLSQREGEGRMLREIEFLREQLPQIPRYGLPDSDILGHHSFLKSRHLITQKYRQQRLKRDRDSLKTYSLNRSL